MQKISGLSQPIDSELPLKRYFLCVGGALLTLLFVVDALMPRPRSGAMLPRIRIHSEHKVPEADTNERAILSEINDSCRLAPLMFITGFASPRTTLGDFDERVRRCYVCANGNTSASIR